MKLDILVDLINSTKFTGNPVGKLGGICKLVLKDGKQIPVQGKTDYLPSTDYKSVGYWLQDSVSLAEERGGLNKLTGKLRFVLFGHKKSGIKNMTLEAKTESGETAEYIEDLRKLNVDWRKNTAKIKAYPEFEVIEEEEVLTGYVKLELEISGKTRATAKGLPIGSEVFTFSNDFGELTGTFVNYPAITNVTAIIDTDMDDYENDLVNYLINVIQGTYKNPDIIRAFVTFDSIGDAPELNVHSDLDPYFHMALVFDFEIWVSSKCLTAINYIKWNCQ